MYRIAIAVALCIHATMAFMPTGSRFASSAMKMVVMPPPPKDTKSGKNILDTAKSTGVHNTLVAALTAAGLDSIFAGTKKLVLFAPTDEAFGKLPAGTVDALLKDIPKLTEILKFHVSENMQRPTRNGRAYATYALHPDGEPKEIGVRVTVGMSIISHRVMIVTTAHSRFLYESG